MSPRWTYLLLCILGTLLPCWQFVPWLLAHGFDLSLFIRDLFANGVGGSLFCERKIALAPPATYGAREDGRRGHRRASASEERGSKKFPFLLAPRLGVRYNPRRWLIRARISPSEARRFMKTPSLALAPLPDQRCMP